MPVRRLCSKCPRFFIAEKATHHLCPACWLKGQRQLRLGAIEKQGESYKRGYSRGYDEGFLAGEVAGRGETMDRDIVRKAVQLCHPDRHQGREIMANEVTAALLSFLNDLSVQLTD